MSPNRRERRSKKATAPPTQALTMQTSDHPPGLVAIPAQSHMPTASAISLLQMAPRYLPPGSQVWFNTQGSSIASKRNCQVTEFLAEEQFKWLLFCDSDMVPPKTGVLQLLHRQKDIIGGLYYDRAPPFASRVQLLNERDAINPSTPVLEVGWIGTGFLLIRRHVLEAIEPPWFSWDEAADSIHEDVYFCLKAREAGFRVWGDTSLDVGHLGSFSVGRKFVSAWHKKDEK